MKTAFAVLTICLFAGYGVAQDAPQSGSAPPQSAQQAQPTQQPPAVNLNAILVQIQQATNSASVNIGKLRIERWKTDSDQKQQLQHIGDSLQKSIANAFPVLITAVESSHGGVSASFKLYHNLNVVYENLNYLADVAGGLGKKDEFDPLAADCAALESARQNLSIYIEQSAGKLEAAARNPAGTIPMLQPLNGPQRKVVVINEDEPAPKKHPKATKKKTSTTPAKESATPAPTSAPAKAPAQTSPTPH
jgi:hypothetical protein